MLIKLLETVSTRRKQKPLSQCWFIFSVSKEVVPSKHDTEGGGGVMMVT